MATGRRKTKVPAAIFPQSIPLEPVALVIEGGAVTALPPTSVRTKANANSFHAVMRQNTAVAAMPVTDCGKITFRKV